MIEDLLTEVFAEAFEDRKVLKKFIEVFIGLRVKQLENVVITTQRSFLKLGGHITNSRPDLVIQFRDESENFVIFFENKVGASEGPEQLQRYADHLRIFKNDGFRTYLFYITKFADIKDQNIVFKNGVSAQFIQIRWYRIYNWFKQNRNDYIDKIINFMEEIGLNESRRFLPQDIYAIQQMSRLQMMMDDSLEGTVDEVMTELFGKAIGWSNRNVQLRDHFRYYKMNDQGSNSTWVGCGFFLTEDEYPLICVTYEVSPTYAKRKETVEAMKWFLQSHKDWEGYDLDDNTKWSGVTADKSLLEFLKEEDHINSIQEFFICKLNELVIIKNNYPNLNWKK